MSSTLDIIWLGHSSFELNLSGGEVILIDPWFDGNPSYPKGHQLDRVDAVLITHGHPDHIGGLLEVAKRFKPPIVAMYEICQWLGTKGVGNVLPMNKGGSQSVAGVKVTMTHAQHSSVIIEDDGQLVYGGEAAGYVVQPPDGRSFYHAGDTCVFSDMQLIRELYRPGLAMLPIGDLFTMDPREAALACRFLKPSKVIPIHYGTFPLLTGTPEQLREHLKDQPEPKWSSSSQASRTAGRLNAGGWRADRDIGNTLRPERWLDGLPFRAYVVLELLKKQMPTVARVGPYRLYFHSHEPSEPPHVHVDRDNYSAKYWLRTVHLARNLGFSAHELRRVQSVVEEHQTELLEAWHGYFGRSGR